MDICEDMLINLVDELDEQDAIRNANNQSCAILKVTRGNENLHLFLFKMPLFESTQSLYSLQMKA